MSPTRESGMTRALRLRLALLLAITGLAPAIAAESTAAGDAPAAVAPDAEEAAPDADDAAPPEEEAAAEAAPTATGITFEPAEGLTLTVGLEAGIAGFATRGTNFGYGRYDPKTGVGTGNTSWMEGYLKPAITAEYALGAAGTLYGGVSAVSAFTAGEGEPGGTIEGGDSETAVETAFAGWRSGAVFADGLGEDAVDLSYGRQDFEVGDGFLIKDARADRGAYWLAPRTAFRRAGLARLNTEPVRADLFYLAAAADQDDTELAGLNLEYVQKGLGTLALMYFHVLDSGTPTNFGPRDGMDVYSVRATELTLPGVPELALWGEYVAERGSGRDGSFDASAWYLEGRYTVADWAWSPALSYRYARFSGDDDYDDRNRRDFEPFFYGYSRGWGTWLQGEVTGEYLLFNSNQINHMLHLSASPSEELGVGAIYYRFYLDQPNYYGMPVSSRHFADELNLYADWAVSEQVSVSLAYGIAFPGKAAREAFGDDDRFQVLELSVEFTF